MTIKEYLATIGSKGGRAAAATVDTKARASKAAKARWAKSKSNQKPCPPE